MKHADYIDEGMRDLLETFGKAIVPMSKRKAVYKTKIHRLTTRLTDTSNSKTYDHAILY